MISFALFPERSFLPGNGSAYCLAAMRRQPQMKQDPR